MAEPPPTHVGDWMLGSQIGHGSFAVVWKAKHRGSGQVAAVKEINTTKLNKKLMESLESEIAVLRRAKSPHIIRMYDIIKAPGKVYLVLEYCNGGDLSDHIKKHGRVAEKLAQNYMQQLGAGLKVLRAHNLIHRDLKPQNLLLATSKAGPPVLKIADFGFARNLQPQGLAETLCGSPLYMAPEILQFQKYDAKADLWSVGSILFELVTGKPPFTGANHVHLLRNIERSEARVPDAVAAHSSAACLDLIRVLLRRNPVERLSFEEFFRHPFVRPAPAGAGGANPGCVGDGGGPGASGELSGSTGTDGGVSSSGGGVSGGGSGAGSGENSSNGDSSCLPFALDDVAPAPAPAPCPGPSRPVWGQQVLPPGLGSSSTREPPSWTGMPAAPAGGGHARAAPAPAPVAQHQRTLSAGGVGHGSSDSLDGIDRDYVLIETPSGASGGGGGGMRPPSAPAAVPSSLPTSFAPRVPSFLGRGGGGPGQGSGGGGGGLFANFGTSPGRSAGAFFAQFGSSPGRGAGGAGLLGTSPGGGGAGGAGGRGGQQPQQQVQEGGESPPRPRRNSIGAAGEGGGGAAPAAAVVGTVAGTAVMDESPSTVPQVRLASLQRCGLLVERLASESWSAGQPLAALALHLLAMDVLQAGIAVATAWAEGEAGAGRAGAAAGEAQVLGGATCEGGSPTAGGADGAVERGGEGAGGLGDYSPEMEALAASIHTLDVGGLPPAPFPPAEAPPASPAPAMLAGEAATDGAEGGRGQAEAAAAKTRAEAEFVAAVERASPTVGSLGSDPAALAGPLPDALELTYQAALEEGKSAGVEELMGNLKTAMDKYATSAALFYFVLVEAPELPVSPPLALQSADRARLRRYVAGVGARHAACAAALAHGKGGM